jgi:hypothetical protein
MFSFAQNISFLPYVFLLITYLGGITAISINIASGENSFLESDVHSLANVVQHNQLHTIEIISGSDLSVKAKTAVAITPGKGGVFILYSLRCFRMVNEMYNSCLSLMSFISRPPPCVTIK